MCNWRPYHRIVFVSDGGGVCLIPELFSLHGDIDVKTRETIRGLKSVDSELKKTSKTLETAEQRAKSLGKELNVTGKEVGKVQVKLKSFQSAEDRRHAKTIQQLNEKRAARKKATAEFLAGINKEDTAQKRSSVTTASRRRGRFGSRRTGAALGVLAGLGAGALAIKRAIDVTREAESANLQFLLAANKAAGGYVALARSAKEYSTAARVSNTVARTTVAELQNVLTLAGRSGELQKFQKGLLDVAAVRGKTVRELIAGIDSEKEAINKLTDFEQSFAAFSGANAERLGSISGQADLAAKSLQDLETNFSTALTQSLEFRDALSSVNSVLKLIAGFDPIDIRIRLKQGDSPGALADEQSRTFINRFKDATKIGVQSILASPLIFSDLISQGPDAALRNFKSSTSGEVARRRRADELKKTFQNEQKLLNRQSVNATGAADLARGETVSKANLKALVKETRALVKAERARERLAKRQAQLQKAELRREKRLFEQRQRQLKSINSLLVSSFSNITQNPFVKLFSDSERAIESARQATKGFSTDLQQTVLQVVGLSNEVSRFTLQLNNQLKASDLNAEADKFRQANRQKGGIESFTFALDGGNIGAQIASQFATRSVRARESFTQDQLDTQEDVDRRLSVIQSQPITGTPQERAAKERVRDKAIISATSGLDPNDLRFDQNNVAANARNQEAIRVANEETAASKLVTTINGLISGGKKGKGIPVNLGNQAITLIDIKSKDQLSLTKKQTPGSPKGADTTNAMEPQFN